MTNDGLDLEPWPVMSATKLEAAERQLNAGVRLLCANEDALAVHTLAFAAYGLLSDLAKSQGGTPTFEKIKADSKLREGKEFWEDFKQLSNFLKHADRDSASTIKGIPEDFNEAVLMIDCFLLRELGRFESPECHALWLWMHALYRINMEDTPPVYFEWLSEIYESLDTTNRSEQIVICRKLLDMIRKIETTGYGMEPSQLLLPWRLVIYPSIGSRNR